MIESLQFLVEALSWFSIILGCFCVLIGSIGFIRFENFWTRLHSASVIDTGGIIFFVVGMCLQLGFSWITLKLILIMLFMLITGPTASHAIANAAYISGLRPHEEKKK